ncbi:hypothetical protein MKX08_007364 [Trichoderma sp. CBMAI-0020]|nr:hypothetical protein MKX08_007364 [Trichoderma sp. CBMAI-0020]
MAQRVATVIHKHDHEFEQLMAQHAADKDDQLPSYVTGCRAASQSSLPVEFFNFPTCQDVIAP